jgi:hypothetical protein
LSPEAGSVARTVVVGEVVVGFPHANVGRLDVCGDVVFDLPPNENVGAAAGVDVFTPLRGGATADGCVGASWGDDF